MSITIDLETLLTMFSILCSAVVGSVLWIGSRIEKASEKTGSRIDGIRDELAKFRTEYVSEELCHERRSQCACVAQMQALQREMSKLECEHHDR